MPRSQWTLMLVPQNNERVRAYHVSSRSIRAALSLVLLSALALGLFSVGFFVKEYQHLRAERLEQENVLLAAEVEEMRGNVSDLSQSLNVLANKSDEYRVIAGLPELDPEVLRVGIGGPGTETVSSGELYYLNQALGEKVFTLSSDLGEMFRRASLLSSSMDQAIGTLRESRARLASTPSISPSDGPLSSLFDPNRHHPVLRITRPHEGIDIAAPIGEPILAPAKGRVVFSGYSSGGYGKMVKIDHGYGYVTKFAHASRVLVKRGEVVERGQVIAEVGATGLVSGPHLHYEVEVNGEPVDPLNFIIEDAIP